MAGELENFGDKAGAGGFHKNPQNINRKGRKPSIDKQIAKHLDSDGTITIPKSQIVQTKKDGSVVIKIPTKDSVSLRLLSIAMSGKGATSLNALKFLVERMDGKATQHHSIEGGDENKDVVVGFVSTGKKLPSSESEIKDPTDK